ncbi:MAG: helix-turn-helix domain-containing protein [Clostridiales bacterium]|jgi:AraC-like DNA-binding protein|nr:helix-turn-helix domain-containing protein [Clostridiales bacterium]
MGRKAKNVVEYRVYELPMDMPGLELTGDQWLISDEISSRLHFHNCLEIGVCHSGQGTLVFDGGNERRFEAGDVTIIPRDIPHTTYSKKGTRSLWSYLFADMGGLLQGILPETARYEACTEDWIPYIFIYKKSAYPRVRFYCECLIEEFSRKKDNWIPVAKSLAISLYYELLRAKSEHAPGSREQNKESFILKPALEHIRQNYMGVITVGALAEICCLSETHFRRLFRFVMGMSPLAFINAARVRQACALLYTTDMPVQAVAEAVGLAAAASFNRSFKQITGVSPREYRKLVQKPTAGAKRRNVLTYKGWFAPEERPSHVLGEDIDKKNLLV